jgi:hypothetical protein
MARHGHQPPQRPLAALLAAAAAALALVAGAGVAGGTPALAATEHKGNCTPYLSLTPVAVDSLPTAEPADTFSVIGGALPTGATGAVFEVTVTA